MQKTFNMMGQFFDIDLTDRKVVVAEGDKLSLGKHGAYIRHGSYGSLAGGYDGVRVNRQGAFLNQMALVSLVRSILMRDWTCEARRYYFNIVGKYGAQVQAVLKRQQGLTLKRFVLFTDRFSQRTLAST